ncbi:MAG: hypothetical protein JW891_04365 [Candidatus Lokiarchaeota archaeon]|nr:hypothetical protein [Candidatus Lokiarchaeota archaeon]
MSRIESEINEMCYYHPYKMSNFRCETCLKPICKDCSVIEKKKQFIDNEKRIVRHYRCKPCYYEKELSRVKTSPRYFFRKIFVFFIYPMLILATIFFSFRAFNGNQLSPLTSIHWIFYIAIIITIETVFVSILTSTKLNTTKSIKNIENLRTRFFSDINTLARIHHKYEGEDVINRCPICNSRRDPGTEICTHCGSDKRDQS